MTSINPETTFHLHHSNDVSQDMLTALRIINEAAMT